VVEAKREDWERDPFKLVEENGWFYARGASDDKAMASVFTDSLIRYAREGFKPRRDIKLALTCGEETPDKFNSVAWLVSTQPSVLDAEFALNEGAGGELDANGKPVALQIQAGEKVYQDFSLDASDVGGHSSRPTKNNPIVRLSAGIAKLGAYNFPVALNEATRGYFEAESKLAPAQIASDMHSVLENPQDEAAVERLWAINPGWNSMLRTTCVATEIVRRPCAERATAARASERQLPDPPRRAHRLGARADRQRAGRRQDRGRPDRRPGHSIAAAAPHATHHGPVRAVADRIWPGVAIVPPCPLVRPTAASSTHTVYRPTDCRGCFTMPRARTRTALNERIRVVSLMNGRRFLYEIVKIYADQPGRLSPEPRAPGSAPRRAPRADRRSLQLASSQLATAVFALLAASITSSATLRGTGS
jgi:hypothetical protein